MDHPCSTGQTSTTAGYWFGDDAPNDTETTPAEPSLPTVAQISPAMEDGEAADRTPAIEQPTMVAFANIVEVSQADGKSYSDLTRRFPN
jgi:hypothetical protein